MFLTLRYALFRRIYARCKAFQIIFVEESVKDSKISQWRRVLRCRGFQILLCRRMLKISRYLEVKNLVCTIKVNDKEDHPFFHFFTLKKIVSVVYINF